MEVEATVSAVVGLRDCVVFGVSMFMMMVLKMMSMMMKTLVSQCCGCWTEGPVLLLVLVFR